MEESSVTLVTKKRRKKSPKQKAKTNAWDSFSIFIRTRDCLITTGSLHEGICFTCYGLIPYKGSHAGHFIQGRNNAVLFDEDGVHIQCPHCNLNPPRGLGGNYVNYFIHMENIYGRPFVDKMIAESKREVIYKIPDYEEILQQYTEKTEAMKVNPSLARLVNVLPF